MLRIKRQIMKLYTSSVLDCLSLTGAWVAILAARGYSLAEIGLAETVFHVTSLIWEIPSGVLADLFGRKKMLIVSSVLKMIGNVVMIFSRNLPMVCMSLAFYAASYNFESGSGDALVYDSLREIHGENYYEKYASNQMIIYRLCNGISTLCAGFALFIGYQAAYSADILIGIIRIGALASLYETGACRRGENGGRGVFGAVGREFAVCFTDSLSFLSKKRKAIYYMFANSFVGAVDTLLLFFLQAKLPQAGMPNWLLGASLFMMEMGGILGARVILRFREKPYRKVFAVTACLVLVGVLAEHSGRYLLMTLGGFLAALGDDAIQVRTNALLQEQFPSEQRATLLSIESFTFSMVMIVLSPPAGAAFTWW